MATTLTGDEGVAEGGRRLREGRLVAFPTETVYGLGANALDEAAVLDIFKTKGRPLTDPLIVHVTSLEAALECVDVDGFGRQVFVALGQAFWPGGLTLVAPSKPHLPSCLSAGTGSVGLRVPSHPLARALIDAAGVPVAAPSANRFGHVSPTTAAHVRHDLGHAPIAILDGDGNPDHGTCEHGVESTVCKVSPATGELVVFRRGAVTEAALQRTLQAAGLADRITVRVLTKLVPMPDDEPSQAGDAAAAAAAPTTPVPPPAPASAEDGADERDVGQEAPGQLVTHYAPDLPTYLVRRHEFPDDDAPVAELGGGLGRSVVLDFAGSLAGLAGEAQAYRDLSPTGSAQEAQRKVFAALRWAEAVPGADRVLLAHVAAAAAEQDEHAGAVHDRLFRAASGRMLLWRAAGGGAAEASSAAAAAGKSGEA